MWYIIVINGFIVLTATVIVRHKLSFLQDKLMFRRKGKYGKESKHDFVKAYCRRGSTPPQCLDFIKRRRCLVFSTLMAPYHLYQIAGSRR